MPAGEGEDLTLTVDISGQQKQATSKFSFVAPTITQIFPAQPTSGNVPITILVGSSALYSARCYICSQWTTMLCNREPRSDFLLQ